jgi:glycosyltransferase involved in cell wall biosynthesis
MPKTTGLWSLVRRVAMTIMPLVRRAPWLHRPVHAAAVWLTGHQLGIRLVRSLIAPDYFNGVDYARWVKAYDTLTPADREAIDGHIGRMRAPPLISVVMPTYNTKTAFLREAIASVRAQLYPYWELCIADDASTDPGVWKVLQDAAESDSRIKVTRRESNGHISAASNTALELATGDFVALMDHDDLLPPQALYEVAAVLEVRPDLDLIYSDEDKIDDGGRRFEPYFKTDWNPELMLGQNMVSHLGVYRRDLLLRVGGFREGLEGSQDFDLALRVVAATRPDRIHHIPVVLYHWRQQAGASSFSEVDQERCGAAAQRAVQEYLDQQAPGAVVDRIARTAWLRVRRPAPAPAPLVSVIVPTRDRADMLARCAEGVLQGTAYPNLELLVVDNDSVEPETFEVFDGMSGDPRVRILRAPGPFNYAKINNFAVGQARGEILLLLNNDIAVTSPGWLDEMVRHAVRPEVGAVGARLLYPDGRVQHGGVVLGIGRAPQVAGHLYVGAAGEDRGYFSHLALARNVSAVTAACLAMRRSVFDQAGGFDEANLAVAFNDVDLCLRIQDLGYQIIWTPHAELIHLESASRGSDFDVDQQERFQGEVAHMRARWATRLDHDPFYGPNFARESGDYRLASPPRRQPPWRRADGKAGS